MDKIFKNIKFQLSAVMLLAFLLRLYKILSPILDLYPTRQEQCAMIARNFFRHGYNIFHPEVDWFGSLASNWRIEFPLVSYIASLFYPVFGIHEFIGRGVSIVFSVGSVYFIFQLTNKLLNQRAAILASLLFAISPLSIYFGRAFMSDATMMFFSIASVYYFYIWLDSQKRISYFLALFSATLAFLLKMSSLYLCLPLLYLAYAKLKNRIFLKPSVYLFFIVSSGLTFLWYLNASDNLFIWVAKKSNLLILINPNFYRRILESIVLFVLTPIGVFLAGCGLMLSVNKKEGYLLHFWLLAVVIYTLLAAGPTFAHYHYQLPFVPIFCIFAAKAIDRFTKPEIWENLVLSKFNANTAVWALMAIILFSSLLIIAPCYKWNRTAYQASRMVNHLTENDAIVIAGRCTHEAPLYYSDRKGFETNDGPSGSLSYSWASVLNSYCISQRDENHAIKFPGEIELIKFLIKNGADYYFTTNMQILNDEPDLNGFLRSNFRVVKEGPGYVIFNLKK